MQNFIKNAKNIGLTPEEKTEIKQSVLNFVAGNPVRQNAGSRLVNQSRLFPWDWSTLFITRLNFTSTMAILLILSVLVGGGVAVGAEKSLPGDVLYPVKVGINEEVRGWAAISQEAKTNWEIKRAERRLEEAEELAAEGFLDADTTAKIEANFEAHADRVRERIEKFNSKENFNAAASVSLNFEKALKVHEIILSKMAEKRGEVETQVRPIRARVNAEVTRTAKNRQEMDIRTKDR